MILNHVSLVPAVNRTTLFSLFGTDSDLDVASVSFHVGNYNCLNPCRHIDLTGDILAPAQPSSQVIANISESELSVYDGYNDNAHAMTGSSTTGHRLGKTAVHETGHWLSLFYPFEGNSHIGPISYVAGDNIESVSSSGCRRGPWKGQLSVDSRCGSNSQSYELCHRYLPATRSPLRSSRAHSRHTCCTSAQRIPKDVIMDS